MWSLMHTYFLLLSPYGLKHFKERRGHNFFPYFLSTSRLRFFLQGLQEFEETEERVWRKWSGVIDSLGAKRMKNLLKPQGEEECVCVCVWGGGGGFLRVFQHKWYRGLEWILTPLCGRQEGNLAAFFFHCREKKRRLERERILIEVTFNLFSASLKFRKNLATTRYTRAAVNTLHSVWRIGCNITSRSIV
jgi:hypothetical protein